MVPSSDLQAYMQAEHNEVFEKKKKEKGYMVGVGKVESGGGVWGRATLTMQSIS